MIKPAHSGNSDNEKKCKYNIKAIHRCMGAHRLAFVLICLMYQDDNDDHDDNMYLHVAPHHLIFPPSQSQSLMQSILCIACGCHAYSNIFRGYAKCIKDYIKSIRFIIICMYYRFKLKYNKSCESAKLT